MTSLRRTMGNNRPQPREPICKGHVEKTEIVNLSSGIYGFQVDQTLSNVTTTLSTIFRWYRFKKIKLTIYPGSRTAALHMQYVPGGGSTTPGAADQSMESEIVGVIAVGQTVPTSIVVNYEHLRGLSDWYATEGDPNEIYLESQGVIRLEGAGTEGVLLKWELDYEFKESMATELAAIQYRLASENSRLKQILSGCVINGAAPK